MIIYDNKNAKMEVFCDDLACDKEVTAEGSYTEALAAAKARGWTVRKVDGVWKHYCLLHANAGVQ